MPSRRIVPAATLLAAVLAAAYLAWAPPSQDLAAATYRAELFSRDGLLIWSNDWYSGHYLLSYSVLFGPLGSWLGVRVLGALAAVAAAGLFARLAERRFGDRAWAGSLWFAAAISAWLLTGRMPFLLAVPFGLAALLAAERGRLAAAAVAAALSSLASPVAGLFVALAGAAVWLAGGRRPGVALALGAAIPIGALNLAFPTGGVEPFVWSAFIAVPVLAAATLWLVPREHRAVRIGSVLYALLAVAAFVVDTPLGGNVTRLGALVAGPVAALVLWQRGRLVVVAVALPLLYWQLVAPVRDVGKGVGDPATKRAYFAPLDAELARRFGSRPQRIEVPPTRNRYEAAYVAIDHPIARGWLRQLESEDFDLFTGDNLTPRAYRGWLREHAVSYVAVPDADLDYLAEDEVALIEGGLDYLDEVWSSEHWRLYQVRGEPGLFERGVLALDADRFVVDQAAGVELPIRWSPYWSVEGQGCVRESADGMTEVVEGAGAVTVDIDLGGDSCPGLAPP